MKYEEIIKLLDAGYSREEILAMKEEPAPADPAPADPAPADPAPADPEPAPADPAADVMKEMKEMFAEMKKELTAMNIMNSRQNSDDVNSGEDILASIINPVRNNGGK